MHLYSEIETYIKKEISEERLKPGDMIETENALAERFGVSRPTVRQALHRLVGQGYLQRIKGKGSFVTVPKVTHGSTSFVSSYRKEVEERHETLLTAVLALEVVKGDRRVCAKLKVRAGSELIRMTRLRRIAGRSDDKPVVLTTVYIAKPLFPAMLRIDFTDTSFYGALEAHGLQVCRASRELEVLPVPADIASLLRVSVFEPVILIKSSGYLEDGTPAEYSESYYPAGGSKFLIEVQR